MAERQDREGTRAYESRREGAEAAQTGGLKPLGFCRLLLLSLAPHFFFPVRASARIILLAQLRTFILRPQCNSIN